MANSLKAGTSFAPELVQELISKVKGESVLANLVPQTPIPFTGTEQFVFNLDGSVQIVGEGEQKSGNQATLTSVIIKPLKFVFQSRITDEFKYASEAKQIQYLQTFSDGFAKKIAEGFDIAALHGLEPKSMTDASFRNTNSFDGKVTGNVVTYDAATFDDNLEAAVQQVKAKRYTANGLAISSEGGAALAKIKDGNKVPMYPEFRFGASPSSFGNMNTSMGMNMVVDGGTAEKDYALVGDFNMFKWGYAENVPLEIIEYGDPDGTGRDLKAYNEICLRAEAYIGWGILDPDAFARVKAEG